MVMWRKGEKNERVEVYEYTGLLFFAREKMGKKHKPKSKKSDLSRQNRVRLKQVRQVSDQHLDGEFVRADIRAR